MRLAKLAFVFIAFALCVTAQTQTTPAQSPDAKTQAKRFTIDPEFALNSRSTVDSNTCFKLRKYVFQPREQAKTNGMRPLGDEMQFAGETDCTYANKVWPKSADGVNPQGSQFGLQSAVARQK